MEDNFEGVALCALGLEKMLGLEIAKIGLKATSKTPGRVGFTTDLKGLFRANLELRTAERILLILGRFPAGDFDALFEGARRPDWERFFAPEDRLVIERVRIRESKLAAQTTVQSVTHKAIYEKLGKVYGLKRMPETGRERSLRIYLDNDECSLGLDLSGEALHRRGWRKAAGDAPLKETVAAGILLLAGYRRHKSLLDPFCGSGTFLIEAAHFAMERAPGLDRHFAIETMPLIREGAATIFSGERERARAAVRKDVEPILVGRDADPQAIDNARGNAARAGVAPLIDFAVGAAEECAPPSEEGILLGNPPWGERLGTPAETRALYKRLGAAWGLSREAPPQAEANPAERFKNWSLGIVTNDPEAGHLFGQPAPVLKEIMNGAEAHWFHWYPADRRPVGHSAGAGYRGGSRARGDRAGETRQAPAKRASGRPPKKGGKPRARSTKPGPKPEL